MSNATNAPVSFSQLTEPCKLCDRRLVSHEGDSPYIPQLHWLACSQHRRGDFRLTPTIYEYAQDYSESEFNKLRTTNGTEAVGKAVPKFFWMLQGIEILGENDYRGLLEYVDGQIATSNLDRAIVAVIIGVLARNGNNVTSVLGAEGATWSYNHELLRAGELTTKFDLLSNWKVYEVEWLKSQLAEQRPLKDLARDFLAWDRVRGDALPGRNELSVAVWLFKLKKVGTEPL